MAMAVVVKVMATLGKPTTAFTLAAHGMFVMISGEMIASHFGAEALLTASCGKATTAAATLMHGRPTSFVCGSSATSATSVAATTSTATSASSPTFVGDQSQVALVAWYRW